MRPVKLQLKDFQAEYVGKLVTHLRMAAREARTTDQAIVLSSPTGSGKTIMAAAAIERILQGDADVSPDNEATFLWLSDQPEINEQTRRKMLETSSVLDSSRLIVIDSSIDQETLLPGKVYFLNIQKLGKEKQLVAHGDGRTYTIWETISNTIKSRPGHFFLFIDEAHRGMRAGSKDEKEAATIVQKFVKGSPGEIPPVPVIVGISATPERFENVIQEARTRRSVNIPPDVVRASGLLKEIIRLYYPTEHQPTDITMLRASAESWYKFSEHWAAYCQSQNEQFVRPILVVQVQDGSGRVVSNTDIAEAIDTINASVGPFPTEAFAHSFQESTHLDFGPHRTRYLSPADITSDPEVRVVIFKTSLNTGWDCPRAETMMSFRKAVDATLIAQLVGRMVRTPLARRIESDEFLNTVALYLPHYDEEGLKRVVDQLMTPDPDFLPPVEVERGENMATLSRRGGSDNTFAALSQLPSYVIPRSRRTTGVRRLMKLARLLANDEIRPGAVEQATLELLGVLRAEYDSVSKTQEFNNIVEAKGKVKVRAEDWQLNGEMTGSETIELDLAKENLDDLFDAAGRKLGEGLHKAWWRSRVEQDEEAKTRAKREAIVLATMPGMLSKVEQVAQQTVRLWLDEHQHVINALPEARMQSYNDVRGLAVDPEVAPIVYPERIEVRKGDQLLEKHLYVDEAGLFPSKLNEWETKVILKELEDPSVIGWIRNFDRKAWSLTIPYQEGGVFRALYPDFLVVRSTHDGLRIDILDPHHLDLADATTKASGLAQYAAKHANMFGRMELITVERGEIRRLNLKDEETRRKVMGVSNRGHLQQLFEEAS